MTDWVAPVSDADLAEAATALFRAEFGGLPDGVWAAPGRVNLIGEHVDYADGLSLPIALPHRTVVAVRGRGDGRLRLRSGLTPWDGAVADVAPGAPSGWAAYLAGVVWAMRRDGMLGGNFGVDVAVASAVPIGAGLSSSAALECALAIALADLAGLSTDDGVRATLATCCVAAENEIALAPTGGMDQAVSLRATAAHALLVDSADGSVGQVPFDLAGNGLALLVIDTRAPHRLVDGQYAERRRSVEKAAEVLGVPTLRVAADEGLDVAVLGDRDLVRRARHVVTEIGRVREVLPLLNSGRLRDIGPLMTASHTSLREDFEVSCPELDSAVDVALAAGAHGARMTGGGFGGSAIALVEASEVDQVAVEVLSTARSRGLVTPAFLRVDTGGGPARRIP
ncbi:galactokinase [Rhodococcus spelaei]|uniref:galactokinase n=1 Tax=Rhodococcus spelaei TaxID=2546320 RepID=UPI001FE25FF1|nr:galactokinase [Rhodococcus spelaei]